jgi:hypothetical protein
MVCHGDFHLVHAVQFHVRVEFSEELLGNDRKIRIGCGAHDLGITGDIIDEGPKVLIASHARSNWPHTIHGPFVSWWAYVGVTLRSF